MNELRNLKNRIDWLCQNKINAFSPTISPAPKSWERNEIESPYEALKYFFDNSVTEFVVQKKYMGSYCDIYLTKKLEDIYFVSRNGHKILHIDIDKAIIACQELHNRFEWSNLSLVIIQAEMLPWSALGKRLINNEFWAYQQVHSKYLDYLKNSNLYEKIESIKKSESYLKYISDKNTMKDKDLKNEYPSHIVRQYQAIKSFTMLDLEKYEDGLRIFTEQISHFGIETDFEFKPFNILKKVYDDGKEIIVNDNQSFKEVNNDKIMTFEIKSMEELLNQSELVTHWFNELTNNKEEGIIVKPRKAFINGLPPGFKIRNNQYLVMIYGIDFINNYSANMQKRNISKKVNCSINDWAINFDLLNVKYKDIHIENYHIKNLFYDRIMGEQIESTLDKRL